VTGRSQNLAGFVGHQRSCDLPSVSAGSIEVAQYHRAKSLAEI
jgi:hypothetical protein